MNDRPPPTSRTMHGRPRASAEVAVGHPAPNDKDAASEAVSEPAGHTNGDLAWFGSNLRRHCSAMVELGRRHRYRPRD